MNYVSQIFALIAALLHILIFCMESLWFMQPKIHRRFGAKTLKNAEAQRLFAFNQGFYNLFLATGAIAGLVLLNMSSYILIATTLVLFSCACMLAAGIVLIASAGKPMLRAGIIQALFPALAWAFWIVLG